jgi:large subunit ribosomal protein L10
MSKYVKDLITRDLTNRFKDVDGVAVINPRGINANKNNAIRRKLHEKQLKMTVVRNTLARRAVGDDSKIKGFDKLLEGPSAVVYGQQSMATIARLLLDLKKADDTLELRGVFFDGEVYADKAGVEQVSKLPTREEAIGQLVALILSPGRNLAAALLGPGGKLGSILKTIEEKAPKGDAAAPDAPAAPDAGAAPAAG